MSTQSGPFTDAPPAGRWSEAFNPSPSLLRVFGAPKISKEATNETGRLLAHNHYSYHAFFNESGFHNHMPHSLLAGYGVQASSQQLTDLAGYATYLDKSFRLNNKKRYGTKADGGPLQPFTEADWNNRLGKAEDYWRYLAFFDQQIEANGIPATLLKFLFDEKLQDRPHHMMARFVGGVVHPLIHVGNGVEFSVPGSVSEGLAMTCLTSSKYVFLFPSDWLKTSYYTVSEDRALSTGDIVARVLKDERLDRDKLGLSRSSPIVDSEPFIKRGAGEHLLNEYVYAWDKTRHGSAFDEEGAMEELGWLTTLMVGAVAKFEKRWRHDFFLAHALTSYLYLTSILKILPPHQDSQSSDIVSPRVALLQAYLRMILVVWISRGRPEFHISDQLMKDDVEIGQREGLQWPELLEIIRTHEDEHVVKALRSLYYLDCTYGNRSEGVLQGYEDATAHLDGTAFVRTARQLVRQFGKQQPSQMDNMYGWDFSGFFSDVPENAPKNRL